MKGRAVTRNSKAPDAANARGPKELHDASIIRAAQKVGNSISCYLWRTAYALEESRQIHAAAGHLWRQVGYCMALSLFRLIGGRL